MFTNRVGFLFKSTSIAFALVTLLSLGAFFVGWAPAFLVDLSMGR